MVLTLAVALCTSARCDVVLRGKLAKAEGVRWAANELRAANKAQTPDITVELAQTPLGVEDGYLISTRVGGRLVQVNSEGAAIYALLDVRDLVKRGESIPESKRFVPALRLRGTVDQFPFWTGTTMYASQWKIFEKCETDPKFWWRDRAAWTRKFREYAGRRTNALMFQHAHPFPAVLEYDRFPEGQVYSRKWAHTNAADFKWIVKEGRKYGVSIYFLTWNIVVPPAFAAAHKVDEFGSEAKVVKDYTRYVVKKLFDTYPDLGGLVTMGAESPVGCTDWVIENVISAMNNCKSKPNLIWWGWCTYPDDSLRVKQAYKGRTDVMHYLQYEQYFKPMADPRIGRWSRETGGTGMIALGGPKSAHSMFTWGNPEWARDTIHSLKQDNNGQGMFLETFMTAIWLARESFCEYMWDLGDREQVTGNRGEGKEPGADREEWIDRIGDRYSPKVAADLLDCYSTASLLIPRFLHLIHSQTDHYNPQIGLPLAYYLGMSTMSGYVFEWYDGLDKLGRLTPNYGLTWPNPNWGEKVLSINQYAYWLARGKTEFSSTTPPQVADDLEAYSRKCLDLLPKLAQAKSEHSPDEYSLVVNVLTMQAQWGMQAAEKIRAAVEWAKFKEGMQPDASAKQCIAHMQSSLEWYRKLAKQAWAVYPYRARFYVSFLSSPSPWKQNDVWFSYQPVNLHWTDMLPRYEKELELTKQQLALGPKAAVPPAMDELWQEKDGPVVASFDFEQDSTGLSLGPNATYTTDPSYVVSGSRSLLIDTRSAQGEWHMCLDTKPGMPKLERGKRYQVRVKYRVISKPNKFSDPFAAGARSDTGGFKSDIGTFRRWGAPTGASGEHVFQIDPKDFDDYHIFLLVHGPAAIAVDDITIAEIAPVPSR